MAGGLHNVARMIALQSFVWGSVMGVAIAAALHPRTEVRIVESHHAQPPLHTAACTPPPALAPAPPPGDSGFTLVNVAAGVAPAQLASLVRLEPGEHVVRVGARPTGSDLEAGAAIAEAAAQGFVDLTVAPQRHVLLLLH